MAALADVSVIAVPVVTVTVVVPTVMSLLACVLSLAVMIRIVSFVNVVVTRSRVPEPSAEGKFPPSVPENVRAVSKSAIVGVELIVSEKTRSMRSFAS